MRDGIRAIIEGMRCIRPPSDTRKNWMILHRSKIVCSNCELYMHEVKKLCRIFQNNGYPKWFINTVMP